MRNRSYGKSVVVPCFNEEENIAALVAELNRILTRENYEVILVDDGSADGSVAAYRQLAERYSNIRFIRLSRNFGHQAALKAGIDYAQGDCKSGLIYVNTFN